MKHVALLRGINVGGKNILPMKDLAAMFVAAGCRDVTTYIQSGNVVFSAAAGTLKKMPATIAAKIADDFGYRVPVIVRSHEELSIVIRRNPIQRPTRRYCTWPSLPTRPAPKQFRSWIRTARRRIVSP